MWCYRSWGSYPDPRGSFLADDVKIPDEVMGSGQAVKGIAITSDSGEDSNSVRESELGLVTGVEDAGSARGW